jgi:hypothetical protein
MSRVARDLAGRVTAAGVYSPALSAAVSDLAAAQTRAINADRLETPVACLPEAKASNEIEVFALGNRPAQELP